MFLKNTLPEDDMFFPIPLGEWECFYAKKNSAEHVDDDEGMGIDDLKSVDGEKSVDDEKSFSLDTLIDDEERVTHGEHCIDFSSQIDSKEFTELADFYIHFDPNDMEEDVCKAFVKRFIAHCCKETIKRGHLRCFKFFQNSGMKKILSHFGVNFEAEDLSSKLLEEGLLMSAVKLGRLNIVDSIVFCQPEFLEKFNHSYFRIAASQGHLNVLKFANSRGLSLNDETIWMNSVHNNHIKVFEFGVKNRLVNCNVLAEAAKMGLVEFLEIGLRSDHIQDERVWVAAASAGKLKCIEFAGKKNIHLSQNVWISAASKGCVNIIRVGVANHELGERVWIAAVENKHFNVILVAINNIVELTDNVWFCALDQGKKELFKLAMALDYTFSDDVEKEMFLKWDRHDFEKY